MRNEDRDPIRREEKARVRPQSFCTKVTSYFYCFEISTLCAPFELVLLKFQRSVRHLIFCLLTYQLFVRHSIFYSSIHVLCAV